MQPTNATLTYV